MQSAQNTIVELTKILNVGNEQEEFIKCLENAEYEKADKILTSKGSSWQLYFDLVTGNSFIHITINGLINAVKKIYKPIAHLSSYTGSVPGRENEKKLAQECFNLVKKMTSMNFPYHTVNKEGCLPAELFTNNNVKWSSFDVIARDFIKLFESSGQYLYTGRKFLTQLTFFRSSYKPFKVCQIPDADAEMDKRDTAFLTLHQRQSTYETIQFRAYAEPQNLVVLNIGFLVSDLSKSDPKHRPIFVTVPFKIEDFVIKATCEEKVASTHSESLMCSHVKSVKYLKSIVMNLQNKHPFIKGQKIYAIILDIHSTREICSGCEDELHALQVSYDDDSFLKKLEKLLSTDFGYIIPSKPANDGSKGRLPEHPKLKVIIRASGLDDRSFDRNAKIYTNLPSPIFNDNPPRDIKTHPLLTIFHLPPNISSVTSTYCVKGDDNRTMLNYKKTYRDESYKADISNLFPKGYISSQNYTAFSNTGGKARDIRKNDEKLDHDINPDLAKRIMQI